ncbi:hypothetical protein NC652_009410 [Populus alba x Populus x berolinensis]|uniref:P-loop containing nucleoside triphosphate hydrolases superfamily protein n=1 Tax=Populus tomentosa TaxID=118781 RepID=A0A8X8AAT4_POPTO|nr:hypothetical protein POTOM_012493 [Populus tomentosa]KAJ6943965.1 hypothetical protein NC652_009410 [Populus alba x Populus x berolinensis]
MVEAFFSTTQMDFDFAHHHSLSQSQSHPFMLLSGPPSCGKTSLLFQFAYNVALEAEDDRKVVFICHRSRIESAPPFLSQGIQPSSDIFKRIQMKYVEDDEGIKKYFSAFHLHDTFPLSVVVDDFGDFFYERKCQERYGNPRGRDLALVRILALCHNAVMSSNDKGHCKLLISDTHHGDSPRLLFLYKRWVPSIFTIKGDGNGSFLLKNYSNVGSDNTEKRKIAKYSLVYQRLLLEGIIEDEEIDNHAVVSASVEQLIAAK